MRHLRKILLATGALFLLSGGVAAAAPGGPGNIVGAAIQYIGIAPEEARTQLAAGQSLADLAVANGKTREGLIETLTSAARERIALAVDRPGTEFSKRGPGPGFPGKGLAGLHIVKVSFASAAEYLGLEMSEVRERLQTSETLAQIADSTDGKSRAGLVDALTTESTSKIDQAVADGKITAEQADQMKTRLAEHVERFVDSAKGDRARP